MKSLKDLKNVFDQESKTTGDRQNLPNNYYPFWNMKPGQRVVIRFLPDLNDNNPRGFLEEKVSHNLNINGQRKTVPCLAQYGEDCPICKVSQEFYKNKDEVNGKKYWKKKQHVAQALIVEDPLPPDDKSGETHEGKVRLISLGYQIYNIIKEAFASDELESIPYSYDGGYDFIIKKTEQGQYASYAVGTKFMNRSRALTEAELSVVEDGLIDLSTLLPKNPGIDKVQAMLDADMNGEDFKEDDDDGESFEKPAPKKTPSRSDDDDDVPVQSKKQTPTPQQSDDDGEGDSDVDEMLAAIRARRAKKQ